MVLAIVCILRQLSESAMFDATFYHTTWLHVSDSRTAVIFGTLHVENCSLQINSLTLNNRFSDRNVFQNDVIA